MIADELMLNDFIMINGVRGKVISLEINLIGVLFFETNEIVYCYEVDPILLNEDILKLNGFDGNSAYLYKHISSNYYYEFYMFERRLTLYYTEKTKDILYRNRDFNYVHEFQHALVDIKDYTFINNFKI